MKYIIGLLILIGSLTILGGSHVTWGKFEYFMHPQNQLADIQTTPIRLANTYFREIPFVISDRLLPEVMLQGSSRDYNQWYPIDYTIKNNIFSNGVKASIQYGENPEWWGFNKVIETLEIMLPSHGVKVPLLYYLMTSQIHLSGATELEYSCVIDFDNYDYEIIIRQYTVNEHSGEHTDVFISKVMMDIMGNVIAQSEFWGELDIANILYYVLGEPEPSSLKNVVRERLLMIESDTLKISKEFPVFKVKMDRYNTLNLNQGNRTEMEDIEYHSLVNEWHTIINEAKIDDRSARADYLLVMSLLNLTDDAGIYFTLGLDNVNITINQ